MVERTYKILNSIEIDNTVTVTYLCSNDPIQESLYQCTFSNHSHQYDIKEHLQFCLKNEDFLDIQGLYSQHLEQSIVDTLYQEIHNLS
ncbi:hypothetical protein JOC85_000446 [Bacillus mesophilus]|uniref:Uncharacterized protein n=1 Tax=Bacillus mesophilus TaxID=1808955 RepID=A0A6M0Q2D5_9BACI|nr:hypothetical protein [Bacillus mesophilus]MBM7659679.1 hypothetical protein [Bacillus mesophilus]NEY70545.1 hypothetical protein [Bacillus mesophilus]